MDDEIFTLLNLGIFLGALGLAWLRSIATFGKKEPRMPRKMIRFPFLYEYSNELLACLLVVAGGIILFIKFIIVHYG